MSRFGNVHRSDTFQNLAMSNLAPESVLLTQKRTRARRISESGSRVKARRVSALSEPTVTQMAGSVLSSWAGTSAHYAGRGVRPSSRVRPADISIFTVFFSLRGFDLGSLNNPVLFCKRRNRQHFEPRTFLPNSILLFAGRHFKGFKGFNPNSVDQFKPVVDPVF